MSEIRTEAQLDTRALEGLAAAVGKLEKKLDSTSKRPLLNKKASDELRAMMQGIGGLGSSLDQLNQQMVKIGRAFEAAGQDMARSMQSAARDISEALKGGLAAAGEQAIKQAKKDGAAVAEAFNKETSKGAAKVSYSSRITGVSGASVGVRGSDLQQVLQLAATTAAEVGGKAQAHIESAKKGLEQLSKLQKEVKAAQAQLQKDLKSESLQAGLTGKVATAYQAGRYKDVYGELRAIKAYGQASVDSSAKFTGMSAALIKAELDAAKVEETRYRQWFGEAAKRAAEQDAAYAALRADSLTRGKQTIIAAAKKNLAEIIKAEKDAALQLSNAKAQLQKDLKSEVLQAGLTGKAASAFQAGKYAQAYGDAAAVKAYGQANLDAARALSGLTAEQVKAAQETDRLNKSKKDLTPRITAASSAVRLFTNDSRDALSAIRGLSNGLGQSLPIFGSLGPLLIGTGIGVATKQVIQLGAAVDDTFVRIAALTKDNTTSFEAQTRAVDQLRAKMLELSRTGSTGPKEIAEAMKTLSLAGLDAKEVTQSIESVLNFAVAGDTTLKNAAEVVSSVATSFKYSSNEYSLVGDVIAKTAAISKSSVEDIGEAFKTASVLGAQYGVNLKDVGLGLASLSNLGIKGTAAGTALRNMFVDLSGRTKETAALMKRLGIELRSEVTGGFEDVVEVVKKVEKSMQGMTAIQQKDFQQKLFSERGGKAIIEFLELLRTQAKDTGSSFGSMIEEMRAQLEDAASFTATSKAIVDTSIQNLGKGVKASFDAALVDSFNVMEPMLRSIAYNLRQALNSQEFRDGIESISKAVVTFTKFLVDNGETIVKWVAGFVVIKSAISIATTLSAAIIGIGTSAYAAYVGIRTLGAISVSSGFSLAALATASTAAGTAMAGASAGATLLMRALGPVTLLITGAAAAYALYQTWVSKAAESNNEFKRSLGDDLVENLDNQIKLARERNKLLSEDINGKVIEQRIAFMEMETRLDKEHLQNKEKLQSDLAKLEKDPYQNSDRVKTGKAAIQREMAELDKNHAAKVNSLKIKFAELREIEANNEKLSDWAQEKRKKETANRIASQVDPARGSLLADPEKQRQRTLQLEANALQQVIRAYNVQEKALADSQSRQQQLLDSQRQNNLIDEGVYQAQMFAMQERAASDTLTLQNNQVNELVAAYQRQQAELKAQFEAGKIESDVYADKLSDNSKALETAIAESSNATTKVVEEGAVRRQKALDSFAGQVIKLRERITQFTTSIKNQLATERQQIEAERQLSGLAGESLAVAQARIAMQGKLADETASLTREVEKAEKAEQSFVEALLSFGLAADESNPTLVALKKTVADLRAELEKFKAKGGALVDEAAVNASEKYRLQKFKETNEGLKDSLADALEEGMKGGTLAGLKSLRKDIESVLRKKFRIAIEAVLDPITRQIATGVSGALGLGSTAAQAGQGGLSTLSNLAGLSSLTSAFGTSFSAGLTSTISSGFATTGLALEGGLAMVAEGTAASMAAGFGQIAGTLGPYAIAAAALYSLYKSLDKSGTPHRGADVYSEGLTVGDPLPGVATTRFGTDAGFQNNRTPEVEAMLSPLALTTAKALNSLSALTGGTQKFAVALQFAADGVDESLGAIRLMSNGTTIASKEMLKFTNNIEQATKEFTGELALSTIDAIKQTVTLPKVFADELESIRLQVGGPTIEALATFTDKVVAVLSASKQMKDAFATLPGSFSKVAELSDELRIKLVDLFGGFQAASAAMDSYYQSFYTEAERAALTTGQLTKAFAELGQPVPATREAFRALVDAQDLTTDSGRSTYAALLRLSSAFAQITPEIENTAFSLQEFSESIADIASNVLQATRKVEDIILQREIDRVNAINQRADEFADIAKSLRSFVNSEVVTQQQGYAQTLVKALAGDKEAMQSLPEAARSAYEEQKTTSVTRFEEERAKLLVLNQLKEVARLAEEEAKKRADLPFVEDPLVIALRELKEATAKLGETIPLKLVASFDKIDTTLDGLISESEFKTAFAGAATETTLKALFNSLDANGDGVVSKLEAIKGNTGGLTDAVKEAAKGTLADKAGIYNALRESGLQDADIRAIVEGIVGPQRDIDWTTLQTVAEGYRLRREAELDVSAVIKLAEGNASLPQSLRDALVNGISLIDVTVKAALENNTPAEIKRILVDQQGVYNSVVKAALEQGLPADVLRIISDQGGSYNALVKAALAPDTDPTAQALALETGGDILQVVKTSLGLTDPTAQALALSTGGLLTRTVTAALGTSDATAQSLAFKVSDELTRTVKAALGTSDATAQTLALKASGELTRTVVAALGTGNAEAIKLALEGSSELTRTVKAILSSTNAQGAYDLAIKGNSELVRTVSASLGTVNSTAEFYANLKGSSVDKTVNAAVNLSGLTEEQKKYLNLASGGTSSTVTLSGSVSFDPSNALKSVFDNISTTNNILKDLLYSYIQVTLGIEKSTAERLVTTGTKFDPATSTFKGIYQLNSSMDSHLSSISSNTYSMSQAINDIASGRVLPRVKFDRGTGEGFANPGGKVFAKGGVFTNSVVTSPTKFDMGLMGEAGPEGILPLARMSDGALGVRALSDAPNYGSFETAAIVAALMRVQRAIEDADERNFEALMSVNDNAHKTQKNLAAVVDGDAIVVRQGE